MFLGNPWVLREASGPQGSAPVIAGSYWDPTGAELEQLWASPAVSTGLGRLWGGFGMVLGCFWEAMGWFWEAGRWFGVAEGWFGVAVGTFWEAVRWFGVAVGWF